MIYYIIPAKYNSRRCPGKNHREIFEGQTLTSIAVKATEYLPPGETVVVAGGPIDAYLVRWKSEFHRRHKAHPMNGSEEIDNSVQVWQYALDGADRSDISVLLEPSSFPRNLRRLANAIEDFEYSRDVRAFSRSSVPAGAKTIVAVRPAHRYGMKAHVFVPTGECYIAAAESVLDGSVFDGGLSYMWSDATNIDTEADFVAAQERRQEWTMQL